MSNDKHEHGFRGLGPSSRVADGDAQPYYFDDIKLRIAVVRHQSRYYAFNALCTHAHCSLSGGLLDGKTIMCQSDGSIFDVTTGSIVRGPAEEPLAVYEIHEDKGELRVKVP